MRRIGVVTVARSDFGIYRSILREISNRDDLDLSLYVGGMHLSPEFGRTATEVAAAGYRVAAEVDMLLSADSPRAIAKSIGIGVMGFADALANDSPDLLVVLGDRFEMYSAALAAVPLQIPIAHIHGGELTEGAIDDVFRHSITKFSHLHFVSTPEYRDRVCQLGEEPWRVLVSGAPGLDDVECMGNLSLSELGDFLKISLSSPPLLVTFHPVTLESAQAEGQIAQLLAALESVDRPIVVTYPNADTSGRLIIKAVEEFSAHRQDVALVESLGAERYFSLLRHAAAMVGNSSSGIIEAATFGLPVVNIGSRQSGRIRGANVVDVGYDVHEILAGIQKATDQNFRSKLRGMQNPYGDGRAAGKIVQRLSGVALDDRLMRKRFFDLESAPCS